MTSSKAPLAATRTRLLMFAAFREDGMDVEDAAWLADLLAQADEAATGEAA